MAARRREPQQAVRKPVLIAGGAAVGAALLGFVLMNFVFGGGGGGDVEPLDQPAVTSPAPNAGATGTNETTGTTGAQPAPTPTEIKEAKKVGLTPGGRDPFQEPGAGEGPAP